MNTKRDYLAECLMIDTMGLRVENVPNLKLPKAFTRVSDDPDAADNYGWAKGNLRSESGKHMSMRVRTIKASSQLLVEGSNSMQYLDHNIVSSGDAVMTAFSMLDAVRRQHALHLDSVFRPREFMQGRDIETTRIDVAVPLKIPGDLRLGAVINALAFAGLRANVATSIYPNESVYFDQHSQLETLKAYDKVVEMQQSRRVLELPDTQNAVDLMSFASSTLRFEGVFRLKQLKRLFENTPVTPSMLSRQVMADMFLKLLTKYELHGGLRRLLSPADLWKIRSPYRTTVALWQSGTDVRSIFNGNEGLLRSHHRVIKRDYSINVLAPSPVTLDHHVELGDILRVENFVQVPKAIRADPTLFYQRDMASEFRAYCMARGLKGTLAAYADPYANTANRLT
jgi:hypothetical protein